MAAPLPLEKQFATAILQKWGRPVTANSVRNVIGWVRAEGGHFKNNARFNPLNTTQPAPGAGNTGSQGNIKVYPNFQTGVDATVKTLNNGRYGSIAAAVNADPSTFARAVNSTPWGTKSDFSSIINSLSVGSVPTTTAPTTAAPVPASLPQQSAGQLDTRKLMALLEAQRARSLQGIMPGANYQAELTKLAQDAYPRAQTVATAQQVGSQVAGAAQSVGSFGGLKMGGGPSDHHARALGNWQSDDAYDLMGSPNQAIPAMTSGVVTKISGTPGKGGGLTGYGITVRTAQGDLFYKHLATKNVKVGQRITPQTILGTLDPTVNGGAHLHLGGTNRAYLDALAKLYTGRGK